MKKLKYLFFICLGFAIIGLLTIYFVKKEANRYCYSNINNLPSAYTGVIFGAGIKADNTPSKYLKDRLDAGIALYKASKIKRILVSGDNGSKNYDELTVMKNYCADNGVAKNDIFVDYAGFDTYSTVFRAKDLFKVDEAIMVSQNYHLDRAVYLGRKMGIKTYGFAADRGEYFFMQKNKFREYLALLKSVWDANTSRKPKYYGGNIDIHGPSNFDKK